MKRIKAISGIVVVFAIIVGVLLSNRSRMQAKSRTDTMKFFPVTVATVARRPLSQNLTLVGTIVGNNDVGVVAETQGKIVKVYVNVGDEVKAGQTLLQVDDEIKKAALEAASATYEKTKKDYERYSSMVKEQSVSTTQMETARLAYKTAQAQYIIAQRQFDDTRIKTPISGIVAARPFDIGTMVQNNTVVANVVDISRLKVKLNVAEEDVFKMKAGDSVRVSTDIYPGVSFKGTISTVSDRADEGHTYPVEVAMANSTQYPLKAGMFGEVSFVAIRPTDALSIPREALVGSMKDAQVYVIRDGIARLRNIVVGGEYNSQISVRSGLSEDEQVVVDGQNNLKDSVAVTVVH